VLANITDKLVTAAGECSYIAGLAGTITESFTNSRDILSEIVFLDDRVKPDRLDDLILVDDTAAMLNEDPDLPSFFDAAGLAVPKLRALRSGLPDDPWPCVDPDVTALVDINADPQVATFGFPVGQVLSPGRTAAFDAFKIYQRMKWRVRTAIGGPVTSPWSAAMTQRPEPGGIP